MQDLRDVCEAFVCQVELTADNFSRWLALSIKYDISAAKQRCFAFAGADDNFGAILRCVRPLAGVPAGQAVLHALEDAIGQYRTALAAGAGLLAHRFRILS